MILILPVGHEERVRRLPVVTLSLMAVLLLVHLVVGNAALRRERRRIQLVELRTAETDRLLLLEAAQDATRDELQGLPDLGGDLRSAYRNLQAHTKRRRDELVQRMREGRVDLPEQELERWKSLDAELQRLGGSSVIQRFGFTPSDRSWITLGTHMFLHGGWGHLLFNLLFLYMSGCLLEDSWGRPLFLGLYLAGGGAAALTHAWLHPGSSTPLIGASGAIAAVMGGFALRHAFARVRLGYLIFFFTLIRFGVFTLPGFVPLAFWFLAQLFLGLMFRDSPELSGVAHWAHIGGFVFGLALAGFMALTGWEKRRIRPALDQRSAREEFEQDPRIVVGMGLLSNGRVREAEEVFREILARKPGHPLASRYLAGILTDTGRGPEAAPFVASMLVDDLNLEAFQAASEDLQGYLEACPETRLPPRLLLRLGVELGRTEYDQAAQSALRRLARDPGAGDLRFKGLLSLGHLLVRLDRVAEAREAYEQVLAESQDELWLQGAREGLARIDAG